MKTKFILTTIFFSLFFLTAYTQDTVRSLFSLTILKRVNNENKILNKFIEIDSLGAIYIGNKKTGENFNIKSFNKEVTKFVVTEKLRKHPGDNYISVIEYPIPENNKQRFIILVKFLDDIRLERELRNKTYYSWGEIFDKEINDYPLFKYLTGAEIKILKGMLE